MMRQELTAVARQQTYKTCGVGYNTFQDTQHAKEVRRAAREKLSVGPSPSINVSVAGNMAWAAQLHAVMQQYAWEIT